MEGTVDLYPLEALLAQFQELLLVLALAVPDDRRKQIGPRPLLHRHDRIDHVLHLHRSDRQAGGGAVGRADAGEQEAKVVIDLGHGADGRPWVLRRRLLLDGNGGREAGDMVDVRLAHHVKELAGIGAQRFHIAALAFSIDRVEGERGLARARQPGDDHQLVAWNRDVHALQVMLARTAHFDELLFRHDNPRSRGPEIVRLCRVSNHNL